ncbi:MAG: sodium/proton antiporter NhaB [Deferribacteraceae bacterium]|jgi:NhaB family Na+:H+ antiporter|nr:sodium/proton antiporter NhaB [Deferribacteraceae bacterium]
MGQSIAKTFISNFLGEAPRWYKAAIVFFLILNPILFKIAPFVAGWALIVEFIFTLALALKCYPLPAGGLLAIEAVVIGMTSVSVVYGEVKANLAVILLLMFMVAGIYFMKEGLLFLFTKILVAVRSKIAISFMFCFMGAFLSAFLDALTVTAVIISVAYGFYGIYHKYASSLGQQYSGNISDDSALSAESQKELEQFRGFLRNIMMHGAVGTALGGAMTLVGEPQNLLIGEKAGWHFADFFYNCLPVSLPVLIAGLALCCVLEITKICGYGKQLPPNVRKALVENVKGNSANMNRAMVARLIIQLLTGIFLIIALALHLAEIGLIGLTVIILLTSFNGVIKEHSFGDAFKEALPFTALLVVFFSIVAVIHDQHLFTPIIDVVLSIKGDKQLLVFFLANGVLSAISDNVFVATVYINEVHNAFLNNQFDREWFNKLAVAINMGTNIPSVATPNGQAAFLFLLTSSLAPLIRLSYMEMVKLALPYSVIMTLTGVLSTWFFL